MNVSSNKLSTEKVTIPIDKVIPNFWNPNHMPKAVFEKMKSTIQEKGLFGAIICRRYGDKYQIMDGEHRMKACKELGWTELPVECAIEKVTDQEVQFWTIYFNNTRGKDDIEKRSKILEALDKGQCQLLPFTEEEIKNEKDLFKFDFSQYETSKDLVVNDLNKVLSLKFTEDEWKLVEEAMKYAKEVDKTPKEWFMFQVSSYINLLRFRANQNNVNVDN